MAFTDRDVIEICDPPVFDLGEKVRATKHIKNDGTFPGRDIGEVLVRIGDVGYVHSIGTFLQRYWIYGVEFVDRGALVGMRARELVSLETADAADDADAAEAAEAAEAADDDGPAAASAGSDDAAPSPTTPQENRP